MPVSRKRVPTRPTAATTVVEPPVDDTLETDRPSGIAPDPLLRAMAAGSRSNGNGSNGSNGSKSNGSQSNGTARRANNGNGTTDAGPPADSEPIEAAAVETTTEAAAADSAMVDTQDVTAETTAPGPDVDIEPEADLEPTIATDVAAVPEVVAELSPAPAPPPPLPLAPPVLDPPPMFDATVVSAPETDAETNTAPDPGRARSRWSLRNLRLTKPTTTLPIPVAGLAPPAPPDISTVPGADGKATAPPSSSPITSPIPVQPPPSSGEALTSVDTDPRVRSRVRPYGLLPEQPPYIRPMPSFDPGLFRTGPVELDPALDPDLPQRPPRLKPVHVASVRRRGRPRMRRVTRVVRHVDPWSVFKVALCFSLVLYGVCLTAGVLLWNVAYTTGTIDNVQRFFESFGWDTFRFKGGELYHNAWIAGLFCAIGLTGMIVLAATLFNLITDLVGGIRVTVLEEEVIERDPAERRTFLRRRSRHTTSRVPTQGRRDDEESIELYEHLG